MAQDGTVVANHTEAKRLLDLARTACKDRPEPIPEVYQTFNKATLDGRRMDAYSELLDQAIRSMMEQKEASDIDSLFTGGRTTALVDPIRGLDDFELVAFLVPSVRRIRPRGAQDQDLRARQGLQTPQGPLRVPSG